MPKQKVKKEKTINELEEDTLNSATSSTNESSTLFEGHEKPSHKVDPPAPMQQQLQQNIGLMSCQDIEKEFSIKQELLDENMPKQKAKKEKTINELEEDTPNSATSSTNESSTLFEGHEKPSHKVDPPAPMQQQLQQNIGLMSCQDIEKEFSIKQELLDGMYYNSKNQQGQLLDTKETNTLESGRVSTPENHDSNIKIKTEKAASVIVKDDSKKISAMELKQELNTDTYFRKLEKPKDAQILSEDLTFDSLSEPIINDAAKLDSQGHSKIMQELLACECIPSPGKLGLNSTVKIDSTFNEIELSTINVDFTSDNSIPLLGTKTGKNCIPESENSNLHQFLVSSDPLTNDTEDMPNGSAPSDLQNLESIVALSNEQIHVSSIEHLKNNITTSSENIHTEVYQDGGMINKEVMRNISSTCLDHSSPTFSSTCSSFDNDSNSCCKTSSKIKEVAIDTEINSSMSCSVMVDNSMLSNENFQHGGNQTSTYSDIFVRSWEHVDSSNSEEVVADSSVFSELGTHLRLLGYQMCKNETIKTFGKKALKEHENNKKLTIDCLFLEKLFPTEVPETNEENKLEEKLAKLCLPTSVPASIVVECKTQNLENKIAQTGLQNANSCFEPEVEKIMYMDLQDTDSSFESIVKITQMDSQDANSYMDCEVEKGDMNNEIFKQLDVQALKNILKNFPNNSNDNLEDSTCETESCLASSLSLTENNSLYTGLVLSPTAFADDEAKKWLPSNNIQSHNTGHNLQEDSGDPFVDNSKAENNNTTTNNLPFEEQSNPEFLPVKMLKKKIDTEDDEFVQRKKSCNEIIMEGNEKRLKVFNYGTKEKSMSLHNKPFQLSTSSEQDNDIENVHAGPEKLPSLQKKMVPKSKKNDTDKEKAEPVTEITKMDTHDKKKKDEKSDHSGFSDMDAGMRFTNRNSSLFEDITKVAQQSVPCRPRPVPQKNAKSNTNHFTMEEIHTHIDTNLISLPEPQKKKPSVKYYSSHNKALSSAPLNRDMFHTKSRVLPHSTQPFPASHLIRDPRLIRRQSDDSSPNLKYIRSYQPNAMTQSENVLQFNNVMRTPTSFNPPNSDYNIWNNSLSKENHVLPTMDPVPKLMNAYLLHSNRSSSPTNPSFLSPSQTASFDDMDLCDSEPPIPPQTIPPVQFRSSHRTQNFDSIRSSASSSYLRDPRLWPTSSHYSGSPLASAMMSSSNVNLPGPRSEDSPYDNVLPLRLSQSVGQTVMSAPQALMVILSWIPDWIKEVNRSNQKVTPPLWRNVTALKEARPCYENVTDYVTTVFPLMLFELFFRMCEMHKSMKDKNANTYVLDFVKFEIVDDIMDIEAEIVLSAGKPHFTIKGQLAVLTFALTSGKKKDVFGFISNQYIYLNTAIRQEVLHLHIKLVCNIQGFNKKEKISVFPFYPLSKFLSQIDALVSIDSSPLRNIILKPSAPACERIILERFGNRAIEKIKDGISLNEPEEPRILIIDSPLGTDLMSTLIAVIKDVNKFETLSEKQPILICTRTMKQLVNITSRLNSTGGKESARSMLNITILVKMNKIPDPKLKELTLEYKISECKKSGKRKSSTSQEQLPEDLVHKEVKKEILKNSDVVLSHIPQSYDSSIKMLFGIGKALQFAFCIVDEAYTFTEPEMSLPLSYGIKKLILAGDSKEKPRVVSEVSAEHKYYQPLPLRLSLSIVSDS